MFDDLIALESEVAAALGPREKYWVVRVMTARLLAI